MASKKTFEGVRKTIETAYHWYVAQRSLPTLQRFEPLDVDNLSPTAITIDGSTALCATRG
jgi:hypothetical protein